MLKAYLMLLLLDLCSPNGCCNSNFRSIRCWWLVYKTISEAIILYYLCIWFEFTFAQMDLGSVLNEFIYNMIWNLTLKNEWTIVSNSGRNSFDCHQWRLSVREWDNVSIPSIHGSVSSWEKRNWHDSVNFQGCYSY